MESVGDNVADSSSQTDADILSGSCGPDCEARFEVKLRDFRARIERELNDQMQVAMRKLEERVCTSTFYYMLSMSCKKKYASNGMLLSFAPQQKL